MIPTSGTTAMASATLPSGPRVFLHIGMNKTGTSAIQSWLSMHARELAREGALYPQSGCEGGVHYGLSRALGFSHRRRAPPPPREELGAALREEIGASGAHTVILSSEDFVLRGDVGAVREFLQAWDARIVVYLRRHDHWWLSVYNQAVRMVARPPWESGLAGYLRYCRTRRNPPGRYRALVDRWAECFGNDRILLRPCEDAQNPEGVVADFVRTVGLPALATSAAASTGRANASLGLEALHLVDMLQRADIEPALRKRLVDRVVAGGRAEEPAQLMPPRLRRRVIEGHREDYEYLARTFLGRDDGVLFQESLPRANDPWTAPELPDRVALVTALVQLLTAPE